MSSWSQRTTYLSVGLMASGFVLIVLAWNGAASIDFVQGQIPFLISGGVAGLGLVGGGLTLALIQELRRSTATVAARIDTLTELVAGSSLGAGGGRPAVVPDGDQVVAGRASYHRPGCKLVEARNDLQAMGAASAVDRGLAPCRICDPRPAEAS